MGNDRSDGVIWLKSYGYGYVFAQRSALIVFTSYFVSPPHRTQKYSDSRVFAD